MPSFPGSVFAPTARASGQTIQAAHVNDLQDEVVALEGGYLNATARLNSSNSTLATLSVTGGSTFAGPVTFGSTAPHRGSLRAPSTMTGELILYPPQSTASTAVGRLFRPDGTEIDISTSWSAGLQEAFTECATGGYDLRVIGGSDRISSTRSGAVVYSVPSTQTVRVPPLQGKSVIFGAITLNFGSTGDEVGLLFDSLMMVHWDMRGCQIATQRKGHIVQFQPSSQVPIDNVVTMTDSWIRIHTISINSTQSTGACVRFMASTGGIDFNTFEFSELNGGQTGILVDTPGTGLSFSGNRITCPHVHDQLVSTTPQIRVGGSTTTQIAENIWTIGVVSSNATKPGVELWSRRDLWTLQMSGSAPSTDGIRFETEAQGNQVWCGRVLGGIANNAGVHTNKVYVTTPDQRAAITVAAGSSVLTYTNKDCVDETLVLTGGDLSSVSLSIDSTTFDNLSTATRLIPLDVGQTVRVGFSTTSNPTVVRLLKGPAPSFST